MAFTELYMQTTGSNLNAGSTTADAASVTQTNGSWDITADTFIATAATPFSGVNIGDWASIYPDANTITPYVSQVLSINAGGLSITLSTTAKYGTKPAAGATGISCKVGGAWASWALCASGGVLNTGTVPASTRLNVKLGTYANTTTARTVGLAGSTTAPFHIEGYKISPHDLEANPSAARVPGTDCPLISFTGTTAALAGATQQTWSNIAMTAANNGATFSPGSNFCIERCQIVNTAANAAGRSISSSGAGHVRASYLNVTSTASQNMGIATAAVTYDGCVIDGGIAGTGTLANSVFRNCWFKNQTTTAGPTGSTANYYCFNCTFDGTGGSATNGIAITGTLAGMMIVEDCLFVNLTNGINQSSGTNTNLLKTRNNSFWTVTNAYVGLSDSAIIGDQTETGDPRTSGSDPTPKTTSKAFGAGSPGWFEAMGFGSFLDIGAVQHVDQGGGGGGSTACSPIGGYVS